jgi:hypothetical protein
MAQLQTTPKRGRPRKKSTGIAVNSNLSAPRPSGKEIKHWSAPRGGNVYMLGQKQITIFDEETSRVREIRYCAGENSIFKDEQSEYATKTPIVFRDKSLFVTPDKPNLQAYLEAHPGNMANGGSLFYMIDNSAKIERTVDDEFLIHDAVTLLRSKDLDELMAVAISFSIDTDRPVSEIKHDLLLKAKSSPQSFIDSFDNPVVSMKAKLRQAEKMQIVKLSEDAVRWYDTNKVIIVVPPGKDPMDIFVRYCLTEGGAAVVAQIDKELG